jgi:hypothetical protein
MTQIVNPFCFPEFSPYNANMRALKLKLLCLAAICGSLQADEKKWVWLNGKLTQVDAEENLSQTELEKNIEWKIIDGKLTKIEKLKNNPKNPSGSKLPIDIPNSDEVGLQTNQYTRAKDITKNYEAPEISSPLNENTRKSAQQSLRTKDQKMVLPKRVKRNPYSKLSATEINTWGKELVQTKNWLNYHRDRLKKETNPPQNFLISYQKILDEWKLDFADYQKAIERNRK